MSEADETLIDFFRSKYGLVLHTARQLAPDPSLTEYVVGQDQGIAPHEYEHYFDRLKLKTQDERNPANFPQHRRYDTGPGNSIDHLFSVWERKSTEPGEIVLGGLSHQTSTQSFYGIVAVPLQ